MYTLYMVWYSPGSGNLAMDIRHGCDAIAATMIESISVRLRTPNDGFGLIIRQKDVNSAVCRMARCLQSKS
jgi:hypothetical protein